VEGIGGNGDMLCIDFRKCLGVVVMRLMSMYCDDDRLMRSCRCRRSDVRFVLYLPSIIGMCVLLFVESFSVVRIRCLSDGRFGIIIVLIFFDANVMAS